MDRPSWTEYFLEMAKLVSTRSKDPSTKVGCVLIRDRRIIASGYNGLPRWMQDTDARLHDRDQKLKYVVHGEINAILNAAYEGISTKDTIMYLTQHPCSDCSKLIAQAGVKQVIYLPSEDYEIRWAESLAASKEILDECGVNLLRWEKAPE